MKKLTHRNYGAPHGRHRADPLLAVAAPGPDPAGRMFTAPVVTAEAVAANLAARAELTKQAGIDTVAIPVLRPGPDLRPMHDLGPCTIWRAVLHDQFVRQEDARGGKADGPWWERYTRIWNERTALPALLVPDYGLRPALEYAAEVITRAEETVEAEWLAAQGAPSAPAPDETEAAA